MAQSKQVNSEFFIKANGRIDFSKPPKGKVFVPIPTDEEDIKRREIDRGFVTRHKFSGTSTLVVMELIDEEEAHKAKIYMAGIKSECKREERKRRCSILSTKTGQVRHCPDCISCYGEDCPKKQGRVVEEGGPASYEDLAETVKSSVYTMNPTADEAIVNVMWDTFKGKLLNEAATLAEILALNEQGYGAAEIMSKLGGSKTWYYDSWKRIRERWIKYNKD